MTLARYLGPPVCLLKSTWKAAPFCDGCGAEVPFKVWLENKRYCMPACRPGWHLLPVETCKLPGCEERIIRSENPGHPREYCSEEHSYEARLEDKRRKRKGEPSIDKEVRGDPALRSEWMPNRETLAPDWFESHIVLDKNGRPVDMPNGGSQSLADWRLYGGDWPNMRSSGPRCGSHIMPTLGSWDPWHWDQMGPKRGPTVQ